MTKRKNNIFFPHNNLIDSCCFESIDYSTRNACI